MSFLNDDPRMDWEPSKALTDCEFCGWPNDAEWWDHRRTGEWKYEFECASCGDLNKDHGNREERGASQVFVTIYASLAALFTIGLIGALGGHWPQGALMAPLIWVASVHFIIRLHMGAKQLRKDHS